MKVPPGAVADSEKTVAAMMDAKKLLQIAEEEAKDLSNMTLMEDVKGRKQVLATTALRAFDNIINDMK